MLMTALILYLSTLLGGSSDAAMGPVLADIRDARGRVHLVAETNLDRRAIVDRLDAVLAAADSRDQELEARVRDMQQVFARHDAKPEELSAALDAVRATQNAELDATMAAYYELRASLTPEQWARLFPAPTGIEPSP